MKSKEIHFNYSDFEPIKKIALNFPGVEESISYGTPSLKVNGKFMCRLHESGEFIPLRLDYELREKYLNSHPETFHVPEHYQNYPAICFWVNTCNNELLSEIFELSWKGLATKKQIIEWENHKSENKN